MSNSGWICGLLPEVGSLVEFGEFKSDMYPVNEWREGDRLEVIAHRMVGDEEIVIVFNMARETASGLIRKYYRAIKTREQIEAEEREKSRIAIREVLLSTHMPIGYVNEVAMAILNAGYTKQGEAK